MPDKVADHHNAGGDTDMHLGSHPIGRGLGSRCDNVERRQQRQLRVLFMRARIAEISEDAVAHALGHDSTVAVDDARATLTIALNDFGELHLIESLGKRGGAHEIAQHHSELPALQRVLVTHAAYARGETRNRSLK